jgi:hypothetical protein
MSTRLAAIATALAGVVTLGVVFAFQTLPEVTAAGGCMPDQAVLLFEVARTAADLEAVFGPADGVCRAKVVAAMDAINTLDVWVFIPAYTAFVSFAALFLSSGRVSALTVAAIGMAVSALRCDYLETFNLLSYTPELTPTLENLAQTASAAWLKFFALGLNGLALAGLCFTAAPRRWILGVLLCLPVIGVALMFADLRIIQAQTLGFFLGWTPLLVLAGKTAITGRA